MFSSTVTVWSGVTIAGKPVDDTPNKLSDTAKDKLHEEMVNCAETIIKKKGYTSYGIAFGVTAIASSILQNKGEEHVVSTVATVSVNFFFYLNRHT